MGREEFSVRVDRFGPRIDVRLVGEIDVGADERFSAVSGQGRADLLVVDATRVEFIGSAGVRLLIRARGLVRPDGEAVIVQPPDLLLRLLDITGLSDQFSIGYPAGGFGLSWVPESTSPGISTGE